MIHSLLYSLKKFNEFRCISGFLFVNKYKTASHIKQIIFKKIN
jgi:hypothetical protein